MRSKAASGTERERESDAPRRQADTPDQKGRACTAPSLAEIRRRARHRLRELSCALTHLQEEHASAVAECTRLRAVNELSNPLVAAPPDTGGDLTPSAPKAETAERAAARIQALQEELTTSRDSLAAEQARTRELQESTEALAGRLREAEAMLSDEQERCGALQARVPELEADLAAEQARTRELQESTEALAGRLREAETMLSDEQERRGALQARVPELEAELADVRAHSASADSPEELQARALSLQVDLERTLEANSRLREEMDGLLRFLDELSEVLPPPGAAQSPVRQGERA